MTDKSTNPARRIFLLCATALLVCSFHLEAQTMVVSLPRLHLVKNERVVGFDIRVRSGRIAQLPNVPIGWSLSVDNDPSWKTEVKGSIEVGAAALDEGFFRRFLVVEAERGPQVEPPFELEGEVFVTSDFSAQKTIRLSAMDFVTEPQKHP